MSQRRWSAVLAAAAIALAVVAPAAAAPAVAIASAAIAPAATAPSHCAGADVPPPPPAAEEIAPGVVAPEPLPWPAEPVGGPLLGTCGDVGALAPPTVGAAGFVLADLDSGAVLAARAPHARHRPASALKVLTALVVLDRLDPGTVVQGTDGDAGIEGSRAGIGPGGSYTVRQLLAGLLLNSGNDTANALARELGGPAATTAAMDATAARLGATDTRAATPSGLDGPGMTSSAYDLALLFRIAMRDPLFAETVATRSVSFPGFGTQPGFELSNTNRLLARYSGALGGKTGFTDAARHTFVGAATRDGRRLVVALVRGEQQPVPMWEQAAALLDLGFALPASAASVGTLVEAAPVAEPVAEPPPLPAEVDPPPPAAAEPASPDSFAPALLGIAAACGALGLLMLRRARVAERARTRSRRRR